jgi:sugar (pentulose or hexulose) kinase
MPDGYILGLDAGTSVVKAAIFDLQGNELSRGARSVPITNPEPHLAEEDMQEVWVAATEAISHALVRQLRPREARSSASAPPARVTAAG